jgi:hypothetical protein
MRRMIAGIAAELAFRRYLAQKDIPFEVVNAPPFTDHNRHDVLLNGQRCDLKSFLISDRKQMMDIRRDPALMLSAPALVPSDIDAAEGHAPSDWYIFTFIAGLVAVTADDRKKVIEKKQPHYFVHVMPERWRKPEHWNPLGELVFKSEAEEDVIMEISGQNEGQDFFTRLVHLPAKSRVTVHDRFYSLAAIHVKHIPAGRLGLHIPAHKSSFIVSPTEWENIWVYGLDIFFAGFITRGEFRQRAEYIPVGARVFQYSKTRAKNLAVQVASLKPLHELFARAACK